MKSLIITLLISATFLSGLTGFAQTTIYPTMDTYIHQSQPTTNWNSNTPNFIEVRNSGTIARISFMDIPVSSITSFSSVSSATLNLYLAAAATSADNVEVYHVTAQNVTINNDATWNSIYPGGVQSYTLGSGLATITVNNGNAVNTQYSFNLTSLISSLAPGTQKVTLCFKATTVNSPKSFWSVDYATQAYRPALVYTLVAVSGVTVTPGTATVAVGTTTNLTATVAPSNAANKTVSWSSSDEAIATVSGTGVVTGVSAGEATITATTQDGSFTSTSTITVPSSSVSVTGVTVSPGSASVNVGATTNLTATIAPENATNQNITWSSSNEAVATVSGGVVTGVSAGSATITATTQDGSFTSNSSITVNAVSVTSVSVSPGTASVNVGATTNLTATIAPGNATNQTINWSTSNASVATVTSGVVTGVAAGTATITATTQDGSFTSTSSITVTTVSVSGVAVTPSATVAAGATTPLTATVAPENATNKTVSWSTSNNLIARVSASGVVTGIAAGSATITATTQDGSFTSTSSITVSAPADNYVLNPGFETNTAPAASATNWFEWTGSANNYIINSGVIAGNVGLGDAVGGAPRSGTNFLSIAPTETWPTIYDVLNKQDLSGLPNGTYTLSAWFRGNGGSGYFNIGGTYDNFVFPMTQWTQKVINNVSVTNGTATINIQYNSTTGSVLEIDDVQLTLNQRVLLSGTQTSAALVNPNLEIIVTSSGDLTIDASKTVKSVTLDPGAKLTINSGQTFAATNGIMLLSTADGTATLVDETTGNGQALTGSVQQFLATTRNWYVSSPVSNANAPAGYTYYRRNEPAQTPQVGWTAVSPGTGLVAGVGYIALPNSSGPITFSTQSGGKINTGTITIPLTWQGASSKGYNLIGNPYPSHLTWNKAFTDANVSVIEPTIWYRTNSGGSNSNGWSFKTYNAYWGVGSPVGTTGIIPPMQAFWVLAKQDGQIQFTNTMRSHQSSNPLKAPKANNDLLKIIRLQVSNGTESDETVLLFNSQALDSYDNYDSPKMLNNDISIPDIFTVVENKRLAINGMNGLKLDTEIPVGFRTATAGSFWISRSEMSNIEQGTQVILKDKLLENKEVELSEGVSYHFTSEVSMQDTNRFSILFRSPGITTGTIKSSNDPAKIYINNNNQIQIQTTEFAKVIIYNALGRKIFEDRQQNNLTIIDKGLVSGIYFVELIMSDHREIQKVIIR